MLKQSEGYFRGKNDIELFFQTWEPAEPTATLVITPGLGEHSECYKRLVYGVEELNIRCVAWDLRGHGRSEGKRGVIENFSDFADDLEIFIKFLSKELNPENMCLLGHSMGGLVNLDALTRKNDMGLECLVFSSPLLGVQVDVPEIKKIGAKYLAKYLPKLTMWNEIKNSVLTHDKKVLEEFDKDLLRHDRISAKLFLQMTEHFERISQLGAKIKKPVLFQVAGQDKVVSTAAAKAFFKTVASADKTLKSYENSYHEIYNDIERETAFKDLREWLKTHLKKD